MIRSQRPLAAQLFALHGPYAFRQQGEALPPEVLAGLVRKAILPHVDGDLDLLEAARSCQDENQKEQTEKLKELISCPPPGPTATDHAPSPGDFFCGGSASSWRRPARFALAGPAGHSAVRPPGGGHPLTSGRLRWHRRL